MGENGKGLKYTNEQLWTQSQDVKPSRANIINNIVVIMYAVRQVLDLQKSLSIVFVYLKIIFSM